MRLWITKDEEGLCLWRTKPALNEDRVWWEDDEEYELLLFFLPNN